MYEQLDNTIIDRGGFGAIYAFVPDGADEATEMLAISWLPETISLSYSEGMKRVFGLVVRVFHTIE